MDDYGQVAATLDEIRRTSGTFSTRHRIVGFCVDVTPTMKERQQELVTEALAEQIGR
jgi:hypothetical protein